MIEIEFKNKTTVCTRVAHARSNVSKGGVTYEAAKGLQLPIMNSLNYYLITKAIFNNNNNNNYYYYYYY